MTGFLLFAGDRYYPGGGWEDFVAAFDTQEAAYRCLACKEDVDWWHVVELPAGNIVDKGLCE